MPGAIPARHLVIEIANFHNKIGKKQTSPDAGSGSAFRVSGRTRHRVARLRPLVLAPCSPSRFSGSNACKKLRYNELTLTD
jgi:hypothetical protein